jgi:hypothetical protein
MKQVVKKRGRPPKTAVAVVEKKEVVPVVIEENRGLMSVDPQALIARAIDKNLPIEQMERLLAMRRELKAEWAREQYFTALSAFQKACPIIGKGKQVNDKYGKKRYKYAPLDVIVDAVKEALEANGFSYTLQTKQTADSVTAICLAHHVAGHSESTDFTVPIDHEAYMNEPQKVASALTYASRYAFRNAFGIMTGDEDDDANAVGEATTGKPATHKQDAPIPTTAEPVVGLAPDQEVVETEVGNVPKVYWRDRSKQALFDAFGPAVDYRVYKNDEGAWRVVKIEEKVPTGAGVNNADIPF